MPFGITNKALGRGIVFTIVEVVTLAVWLIVALQGKLVLSIIILIVGLLIEHILAIGTTKL